MTKTGSKCGSLVFAPASTTPGVKDSAETKEASFQGGWDQPQLELEKWPFRMKTQIINPGLGKGLNTFIIIINITVITTICHHLAYYIYFFTTWFYFISFHFILFYSRFRFTAKLRRQRSFPFSPQAPHTCIASPITSITHHTGIFSWSFFFFFMMQKQCLATYGHACVSFN